MATNTGTGEIGGNTGIGGYGYQFVEEPPVELVCLICLDVAKKPQQHGECGKLFCLSCITEHRKTSNQCPHCRRNLTTFNDGKSAQDIKALRVKCDNVQNGCTWEGDMYSIDKHVQKCGYTLVPCPNQCKDNGHRVTILRKDIDYHVQHDCSERWYTCPDCFKGGIYRNMTTTHLKTCRVKCPNAGCKVVTNRCDLDKHRLKCQHEKHPCKFSIAGCPVMMSPKKLKEHDKDIALHLQLTTEKFNEQIEKQNEKIAQLQEEGIEKSKKIAQLQEETTSLRERIAQLQAQVSYQYDQIEWQGGSFVQHGHIKRLEGMVEELKETVKQQSKEIGSLQPKKSRFKK